MSTLLNAAHRHSAQLQAQLGTNATVPPHLAAVAASLGRGTVSLRPVPAAADRVSHSPPARRSLLHGNTYPVSGGRTFCWCHGWAS